MSLFRAVAWDIDGTLIDSEPLHERALAAASAALGADLSDLDPEAFRGVHARDIWKALEPRFPATLAFKTWIAAIEDDYIANSRQLRDYSGRHRGDAGARRARSGAGLRVEFRPQDRRC